MNNYINILKGWYKMNKYYVYIKGIFCNKCYIRIRKTKNEALKGFNKKDIHSITLIQENV